MNGLRASTIAKIDRLASDNRCLPMTNTLIQIWEADNEKALIKLDQQQQLIPLIENLMPNLDIAQDMRAEPANRMAADFEILQMAGLPLHVPTSTSVTS